MKRTLLLAHGGAPTTVLNASLFGILASAKESGKYSRILAYRHGIKPSDFIDLTDAPSREVEELPFTPGSAIETRRTPLEEGDYGTLAARFHEDEITDILLTGDNGTMDTTRRLAKACFPLRHSGGWGIPKTIDNDIACRDLGRDFTAFI